MSTKTPEQIAQATLDNHAIKPHWNRNGKQIAELIAEAIEADRAQRDLCELIAEALDEREGLSGDGEAAKAAAAVRCEGGYEDVIWDCFIGPMLDQLERVYGE